MRCDISCFCESFSKFLRLSVCGARALSLACPADSLEGGVYTDTDTICLKPISLWGQHPRDWEGQQTFSRESKPSVIIGIEADVGDRVDWNSVCPRSLGLRPWTLTNTYLSPAVVASPASAYPVDSRFCTRPPDLPRRCSPNPSRLDPSSELEVPPG